MTETLAELAETDALLTALSRGNQMRIGDPVIDALSGWVDEIVSHPLPRVEVALPEFYARETGGRAWRIAAAAIVVTAMSSSGIAAAATGDPLAPFNYVATALGHLAPSDRADDSRYGAPLLDGVDPGARSRQSDDGSSSDAVGQPYGPYSSTWTEGRHRGTDSTPAPRHRSADSGDASSTGQGGSYTPTHLAGNDDTTGTGGTPAETPPVETPPVETPPVETPPVDTPPVETPPVETPADPDPQPVPSDGPVVANPASSDSGSTGGGATGSESTGGETTGGTAADTTQVRVSEDAPSDTPGADVAE